jgi:molybdopterin-synthase adenylyltransferase
MKTASIRVLQSLWDKARSDCLSSHNEAVAFMTAKYYETDDRIVFLPENVVTARLDDYLVRGPYHLEVSPLYVNRVLNIAEHLENTVVMVHSHPFETGKPHYSASDDSGEALTSETISKCLNGAPPVGSLLFSQRQAIGRGWIGTSKSFVPGTVSVIRRGGIQLHDDGVPAARKSPPRLIDRQVVDRQIRMLGEATQLRLEKIEVGIVGLGGTGSSVAEQLVRMGIRKLTIVDHDRIEPSNLSRVYGSIWNDVVRSRYKVDLTRSHLKKINPAIEVKAAKKTVMARRVLKSLANCDVVFSCVDRHAPRAVLNELSYQCFIPLIDIGIGVVRDGNKVVGGTARATIVGPGLPCLLCTEVVRPELVAAEHLSPQEYESRRAEGYVPNLDRNVPSVINYTSLASSLGLMLFLDMMGGKRDQYSSLLVDLNSKQLSKVRARTKQDCVCRRRLGKGFSIPFSVAD